MHPTQPGHKIYGIVGPSGTGKSSLLQRLVAQHPHIQEAVSYTTRAPREGEVVGKDYHYISRAEFEAMMPDMVEHVEYNGNMYGMSKTQMDQKLQQGPIAIIIEGHGAVQFKKVYGEQFVTIFLLPPSLAELERRLFAREKNPDPAVVARRLASVQNETWYARHANYTLPSGTLDATYDRIVSILRETGGI